MATVCIPWILIGLTSRYTMDVGMHVWCEDKKGEMNQDAGPTCEICSPAMQLECTL